jgi:hypothetical protein
MGTAGMEKRDRVRIIERVKEILIAVLFISAILLLAFFWKDISLEELSSFTLAMQEDDAYTPELSELMRPLQIKVNFGSDIYTVLSADWKLEEHGISIDTETDDTGIYDYMRYLMMQYLNQPDIMPEKIEKAQYDEVMSYPSMTASFSFDIPFADYLENYGTDMPSGGDTIACMTKISFSSASSENLFIYDASADTYYRFVTQDETFAENMSAGLSDMVEDIENSGITVYYTIESLAGIKNDTLIPLYLENGMESVKCSSEFSISDNSEISSYEQMFFPSGLDFVRKITENKGSLIYTYGYSQKVLVLDENGSISYSEELDSTQYSEIGFYEGLSAAVEYIKNHGGWSVMFGNGMKPYLREVEAVQSDDGKYKGYRYGFGVKLNDVPVTFSTGNMLNVEIYGSQVTLYERDIISMSSENIAYKSDIINAIDVITDEYEEIESIVADAWLKAGEKEKADLYISEDQFDVVVKNIDMIQFCMLRDTAKNPSVIVPAWYIKVDGVIFWCDVDDGHILAWNDAGVF